MAERVAFIVKQHKIELLVEFTLSKCLACNTRYVLLAVLDDGEVVQQKGGYYCPYCGGKFEPSPRAKEEER